MVRTVCLSVCYPWETSPALPAETLDLSRRGKLYPPPHTHTHSFPVSWASNEGKLKGRIATTASGVQLSPRPSSHPLVQVGVGGCLPCQITGVCTFAAGNAMPTPPDSHQLARE